MCANKSETVHRLQHLARPAEINGLYFWEALARPRFQPLETFFEVIRLSGLMVFTTHNEQLGFSIGLAGLQPDVMIRIRRVPVEGTLDQAFANAGSDGVTPVAGICRV